VSQFVVQASRLRRQAGETPAPQKANEDTTQVVLS
jgi:hypothetical protein